MARTYRLDSGSRQEDGPHRLGRPVLHACLAFALTTALCAAPRQGNQLTWSEYKQLKEAWIPGERTATEVFGAFRLRVESVIAMEAAAIAGAELAAPELARVHGGVPANVWIERAAAARAALTATGVAPPTVAAAEAADFSEHVTALHYACYTLPRVTLRILRGLGTDLDVDERGVWIARARAAAELLGDARELSTLDYEWVRSLRRADRGSEALEVSERARTAGIHPELEPYLTLAHVDLLRRLGRLREARDALAGFEASLVAGPDVGPDVGADAQLDALRSRASGMRAHVLLDMGLPDLAFAGIRTELDRAEALARSLDNDERLVAARIYALKHAQAVGDAAGTAELARRFLGDEDFYVRRPSERAYLLFLLGRAERRLEQLDPARPRAAEARLEEALEVGLDRGVALTARIELARLALLHDDLGLATARIAVARERLDAWTREDKSGVPPEAAEVPALEARIALARGAPVAELRERVAPLAAGIEVMIERWAREPRWSAGSGLLVYRGRRASLGAWIRLHVAIDSVAGVEAALPLLLRAQAQTTLARALDAAAPSAGDVRGALLPRGRGLLFFVPGDGATHVLALDHEGSRHAVLAGVDTIAPQVGAYRAHVEGARGAIDGVEERDAAVAVERELAGRISRELLPPGIAERLQGWSSVWVAGLDLYGAVPFEWLPVGEERFLGFERPVAHLPSIPLGVELTRSAAVDTELDLVLIGDARPGPRALGQAPQLAPLPLPQGVIERIAGVYSAERVRVLAGPDASLRALAGALDAGTRTLHLLVHGLHVGDSGDVGLVLTPGLGQAPGATDEPDDGVLWRERVRTLAAPRLAVLMACRSGAGRRRHGDAGSTDMTGAWIQAGARAVIVTRAEIGYRTAVEASSVLHRRLARGDAPAEALRRAFVEVGGKDDELAPFRLGIMRVVGLGHEAPDARGVGVMPRVALGVLGVLGVLAAAALAWSLRRSRRRDHAS
ncbi:MAG: CHAT domain-containing protein [bacterium]|nr:CHAT domain-containing protein [bacterium]